MDVAAGSAPDAIGLISWNEFSENSYVEPSCSYGGEYLAVIASLRNGVAPAHIDECDADIVDAGVAEFTDDATPEPAAGSTTGGYPDPAGNQSDFDSSSPGSVDVGVNTGIISLIALACLTVVSMAVIARRARRHEVVP